MPRKPKCLMAVTERVRNGFFDEQLFGQLQELTELRVEIMNRRENQAAFGALLASCAPEILIGGWQSPTLTESIHAATPTVKLFVYTAGAIRQQIDKSVMESGVRVTNWGDTAAPSVAEATLMMMLASLRKVPEYHNILHHRKGWRGGGTPEGLFYKNVGLHGFGRISRALVKLLEPFHCNIRTYSPHVPDALLEQYGVGRAQTLQVLYAESHVVVVLASKTDENYHVVNERILGAMPDGAHLVLTGRGAVVDTEALIRELKTGRLFAALDVYEKEPLDPDSPLRGMDNCMLLPHQGGPTSDMYIQVGKVAVENIKRWLDGEPLINEVTPDLYELMT